MKREISFTVYGKPYGKKNMKPTQGKYRLTTYNPKENVIYGQNVIVALSKEYEKFEESVYKQPIFFENTQIEVEIAAYYEVPKSYMRKQANKDGYYYNKKGTKMLKGEIRPIVRPDLDNISKIICDAITNFGLIWRDDSQIVSMKLEKYYDLQPRVEVTVKGDVKNG